MSSLIKRRHVSVTMPHLGILPVESLEAGSGPPLILLHGVGDSALSWRWAMPGLARTHHVYAPSLPGFGASAKPRIKYNPDFFTYFVSAYLDALDLEQVSAVGNSLGGLVAMRLALTMPDRIVALGLVDSAGLGRSINMAMRLITLPGVGKMVTTWNRTSPGSWQWALLMTGLLFAHPSRAPREWTAHVRWMAQSRGYLQATVSVARSGTTLRGQRNREIMLDHLPKLRMPTLVVWGDRDRMVPSYQAETAAGLLPAGELAIFEDCGHLPHIERAELFVDVLSRFLDNQIGQYDWAVQG